MGLPRTFFSLFHALKDPGDLFHERALRLVDGFSLFVLIFDHPTLPTLDSTLISRFSFLDNATSDRLLFFAPIDEPPGWRGLIRERGNSTAQRLIDTYDERLQSPNKGAAALSLASMLGLETTDLPALAVTRDLRRPDFLVLPTSRSTVIRQLMDLAEVAHDLPRLRDSAPDHGGSLPPIAVHQGFPLAVAHSLSAQVYAALSGPLQHAANPALRRYAKNEFQATVQRLGRSIDAARTSLNSSLLDEPLDAFHELFRNLERLAAMAATACTGNKRDNMASLQGWDANSLSWIDAASQAENALENEMDFSPVAVCWAKAFEWEAALSSGHLVRHVKGVDLPQYFCRHQPEVDAAISIDGSTYDFNQRGPGGSWRTPELGRLRMGHKFLVDAHLSPDSALAAPLLLQRWAEIRKIRNHVCHPYAVTRERAMELRGHVKDLATRGHLRALFDLKTALKDQGSPPEGTLRTRSP